MNNNSFSQNNTDSKTIILDEYNTNLDEEIGTFLKIDYCKDNIDKKVHDRSLYTVLFYALMFLFLGSFIIVILQQFYIETHNITKEMLDKNYIYYDQIVSKIENFSSAYGNLLIYLITLAVVLFLMFDSIKEDLIKTKRMGTKNIIKYCLIGYLIFITCSFIGNIFITYVGEILKIQAEPGNEQGINDIMASGTTNLIVMSIATVVLAPFLEEIVFRKGLFNLLSKKFKPIWIIIISGLIFGSIHIISPVILELNKLAQGTGGINYLIYEFSYLFVYGAMGIAFGLIYQLSHRNLTVTIILHMINNFISVLYTISEIYKLF